MALAPISLYADPMEDYAGWWVKFYNQGTTTPKSMATDSSGSTLIAQAEVSSGGAVAIGFIKTSGNALFIPFVDGDYDYWIFPTEAEAVANDTTDAIQLADNLNTNPFDSSGGVAVFDTVANMKLESIVVGRTIATQGYSAAGDGGDATYFIVSPQSFDGFSDHELANGNIAVLQIEGNINPRTFGAVASGASDSGPAWQAIIDVAVGGPAVECRADDIYLIETQVTKDLFTGLTMIGNGAVIDFQVDSPFKFGDHTVDGTDHYTQTAQTIFDINISGFTFEPSSPGWDGSRYAYLNPIDLSSAKNVLITDCIFNNFDFAGVNLSAPSINVTTRDCSFSADNESNVTYGVRPFCYPVGASLDNYDAVTGQLSEAAPTVFHQNIIVEACDFYQISRGIISWNVHGGTYINNSFRKPGIRGISATNWNFDTLIEGNQYFVEDNSTSTLSVCIRVGVGSQRIIINNERFTGELDGAGINSDLKTVHVGAVCRDVAIKGCIFGVINQQDSIVIDANSKVDITGNKFLADTLTTACITILGDSTGTGTYDQPDILLENNYVPVADRFVATSGEPIGTIGTITIRGNIFKTLLVNRLFASDSTANWILTAYDNDLPLGAFSYAANFGAGGNTFKRFDRLERQMQTINTAASANVTLDWRDYGGEFWYIVPGMAQTLDDVTNQILDGARLTIMAGGVVTIPQGNFRLDGSVDYVMGTNDILSLVSRAGLWFEVSRSVN